MLLCRAAITRGNLWNAGILENSERSRYVMYDSRVTLILSTAAVPFLPLHPLNYPPDSAQTVHDALRSTKTRSSHLTERGATGVNFQEPAIVGMR